MANPRKFSEKIALHTQKQAEETAAFEEIMREVMGATRVSSPFLSYSAFVQTFSVARIGKLLVRLSLLLFFIDEECVQTKRMLSAAVFIICLIFRAKWPLPS